MAILSAIAPEQLVAVRELFQEYVASVEAPACFTTLAQELADLPGEYAPPGGQLLLAMQEGQAAGCVALRQIGPGICELKRLYVRPNFRGHGLGRALAQEMIAFARKAGYARLRLDTLESMKAATTLYKSLGFQSIPAYNVHPVAGTLYFELAL